LTLAKRGWLLLLVAVCAVYLFGIGAMPFVGPDEPRYAQVAREMFMRGDLVTPTLAGDTWFEKPAPLYWIMIAGYATFGVSEFAARAGSALSGALTVLVVWWLAKRVDADVRERAMGFAFTCAAIMASTAGLIVFSHGASFDSPLTMSVTAALACFFLAESEPDGPKRMALLIGFHASIGATLLAKGLVGPVIVYGVVGLYLLIRRNRPRLLTLGILWGPLVTLAVAAIWYGPVIIRHGWGFVDEFFLQHHLARFTSNKYHHPQRFYFYVPITALLALPWTAFLASGLLRLSGSLRHESGVLARLRLLAACWFVVPIAFFTLSGSKLPGYVLPSLPAAAILAGSVAYQYLKGEGGVAAMRITGALALLLFAAGLGYASGFFGSQTVSHGISRACVLAIVLPSGVVGSLALFVPRRRALCFSAVTLGTFLTVLLIVGCAVRPLSSSLSVKSLIEKADAEGFERLPVFHLHVVERTSEFYAAGRLVYDDGGDPRKFEGAWQILEELRKRGGRGLVIVPRELVAQLLTDDALEARSIADNGELAIVYVRVK
jgi:4-amino-4-deoxy-L-arabinose transferase-like glycosyltransferase